MLVSIVTATIGNPLLEQAIQSVQDQDYDHIEHTIVIDGKEHEEKVNHILQDMELKRKVHILCLPYPTGKDGYICHRIYGASNYIVSGDYIIYLDEDNWFDPYHISSLVELAKLNQLTWAYALRKIVDTKGHFVTYDDCESLGQWPVVFDRRFYHIDTNCFFIRKDIAIQLSPIWHRRFREQGLNNPDTELCVTLLKQFPRFSTTGLYTVNYRIGSTNLSVKSGSFLFGNAAARSMYPDGLPWRNYSYFEREYSEACLKDKFGIREINLIAFPNWDRVGETDTIQQMIMAYLRNPSPSRIALFLYSGLDEYEKASSVLTTLIETLMMQLDDHDLEKFYQAHVSLVQCVGSASWQSFWNTIYGIVAIDYHESSQVPNDLQLQSVLTLSCTELSQIAIENLVYPSVPLSPALKPPPKKLDHFIVLSHPGAGAACLSNTLNQQSEIYLAGEIFNPNLGRKDLSEARKMLGLSEDQRLGLNHIPDFFDHCAKAQNRHVIGFILLASPMNLLSMPEIDVLIESGYKILILWRDNLLKAYCSWLQDIQSEHAKFDTISSTQADQAKIYLDPDHCCKWIYETREFLDYVRKQLASRYGSYLELEYENCFVDNLATGQEMIKQILLFLDVSADMFKINPQSNELQESYDYILNRGELEEKSGYSLS